MILALDTSTDMLTVALSVESKIYCRHQLAPKQHGELLLKWIQELIEEADITLSQLEKIIVGVGPGGFTGIRVGVGVAQGVAFAHDIPVVAISSLQCIAHRAAKDFSHSKILVQQDARMGEVYWGAYDNGVSVVKDQITKPEDLMVAKEGWLTVGDYQTEKKAYPNAASLLELGASEAGVSAEQVLPVYLRDKSAWSR